MTVAIEITQDHDALLDVMKMTFETHNKLFTQPYEQQKFSITLKDDDKIIGGLTGYSGFDWFYIEMLTVDENYRDNGYAVDLLQRAEKEAKERNCVGIWLTTISFQAPGFYKKFGYEEFGRLDNLPRGHDRIYLKKYL